MMSGLPHLLTASRVVMGAVALDAGLDGHFTRAAAFITASAVVDGLDGKLARWLNAASPFGGVFDYFCDYLCFVVAPWLLTRALVRADGGIVDAVLTVPLVTGAARYARSGVIVAAQDREARDLPGLATMFFAFVSVLAVYLDLPAAVSPPTASAIVIAMSLTMSSLMIVPVRYPKLAAFRGVSPAVLVLLAAMPIVGTRVIAWMTVVIGLGYVIAGPWLAEARTR